MLKLATMGNNITFLQFKNALVDFPVFSTTDIYKVFPNIHRRRLHEWVGRGLLKRIVKGYYIFSDVPVDEGLVYSIANRIYNPSYISLQSALNWYGLIPEFVPQITSVSTKKTTTLSTGIGSFAYSSVKESLMFGYDILLLGDRGYKIKMAYPEKAILDLLYLNPHLNSVEHFSELRFNSEVFREKVRPDVLAQYLSFFSNKSLSKRVNILSDFMSAK
jgi:predicted transcriptional regulator of viral defense system